MDSKQTLGCLSFALYWAWLFSTVLGGSLLQALSTDASLTVRLAGSAGIAAGLLAQYFLIPRIGKANSLVFAIVAGAFPITHGAALLIPAATEQPALMCVLLFLAGAASSLVLCGIGGGFSGYPHRYAVTATCLASSLGAFLSVIVNSMPVEAAAIFSCLLMPASAALYRMAGLVPSSESFDDRKQAFAVVKTYRSMLAFMFLYSMLFGFVIVAGALVEPVGAEGSPLLIAISAPGVIMLLLLTSTQARVDVESLRRIFLAMAIIGLVPLAFLGESVGFYALLFLSVCFGMFDISNIVTLYEIIRENGLPRLSSFAIGRVLGEAGIASGWALGLAVSHAIPGGNRPVVMAAVIVAALMVVGLAVFSNRRKEPFGIREEAEEAEVSPIDPYAYHGRAIADLAAQFELSPREQEVFEMLCAGRTPKRISEKLFISESTAKSHCHRIYQKLGIHSQQDLLDVFEERMQAIHDEQWKPIP